MTTPAFGTPEWSRQASESFERVAHEAQEGFERAARQLGEAVGQMQRTLAVQGAMSWAYRGDVDQARATLPTGRSTWWCSCGAKGAGPNAETTREICDHLGIDENGEQRG